MQQLPYVHAQLKTGGAAGVQPSECAGCTKVYGVVLARTWNNQLVRSTNTSARLIGSGASREDTEISKAPEFVFPFSAFVKTENAEKINTPRYFGN